MTSFAWVQPVGMTPEDGYLLYLACGCEGWYDRDYWLVVGIECPEHAPAGSS